MYDNNRELNLKVKGVPSVHSFHALGMLVFTGFLLHGGTPFIEGIYEALLTSKGVSDKNIRNAIQEGSNLLLTLA